MTTSSAAAFPLTPMQEGMFFHSLSDPTAGMDLEQIVWEMAEPVDADRFELAWRTLIQRHDVFRTSFRTDENGRPSQQVHRGLEFDLIRLDWRGMTEEALDHSMALLLSADREAGFALADPPLLRVTLVRITEECCRVVWSFPHIILDGRSFPAVLREALALYAQPSRGDAEMVASRKSFRDHVEWISTRGADADEAFWRERFAGFAGPTPLPAATEVGRRSGQGRVQLRLPADETSSLNALAVSLGSSLGTIVQGAWAILLHRHAGESDICFGTVRAGRHRDTSSADAIGNFICTLPVRVEVKADVPVDQLLRELRSQAQAVRGHEHTGIQDIQRWTGLSGGSRLCSSLVMYDHASLDARMRETPLPCAARQFTLHERTSYALALYAYGEPELLLQLAFDREQIDDGSATRLLLHLRQLLRGMVDGPRLPIGMLDMLSDEERSLILETWNDTRVDVSRDDLVHQLISRAAARRSDAIAVVGGADSLSFAGLETRSNRLAHHLRGIGIEPGAIVGLCVQRTPEMLVSMLGILKCGAAYLPLDPAYPTARLAFMLEDSSARLVITDRTAIHSLPATSTATLLIDDDWDRIALASDAIPPNLITSDALAYVIYTSGSTGQPKGVMIRHRNVVNFFVGMDAHIPKGGENSPGVWLALTSLSFDISVLELLWTLARGMTVVLHREGRAASPPKPSTKPMQFSLFYFASAEEVQGDRYRLLLDGARFADRNGFTAVWTPERHFHAFGGAYPNPAVTGAAVAAITERVRIRAGSVVLPLHHPARVAEEWSIVDNLSGGRVDISVASGWQPNDFVLRPENFTDAKGVMMRHLDVVRRLWRGESVEMPGPRGAVAVRTLPRPVQPELPVWITTAGSPESFRAAGIAGANVLTHLLGQTIEELKDRIAIYRDARRAAGHGGRGHVSLMIHTLVGNDRDTVREIVREPMKNYLRSSLGLIRGFASSWTAFKRRADGGVSATAPDLESLSPAEMDSLLDFSFERYFEASGLFGSVDQCAELVDRLHHAGVDEIAALVDFGVAPDSVLTHLESLAELRVMCNEVGRSGDEEPSLAEKIVRHRVTHVQCTPSMGRMLLAERGNREALKQIRVLLVGGEALPDPLAAELCSAVGGQLLNMYGPTETTIWSSVHPSQAGEGTTVPIGRPIANTDMYVLDASMRPVPIGTAGELYIGGDGVAAGYLNRPELTAQRFVPHLFRSERDARLYRTGDIARYRADGVIEFLGRVDQQVKLRGHRIELGEIESVLMDHEHVRAAAVIIREDTPGDQRIVAYVVGGRDAREATLREHLRSRLPDFMMPSHFVLLDEIPLTPNAKIDRRALPAPHEVVVQSTAGDVPSATALERRLAVIWQEVLGLPSVGPGDNFFDLGGHSLLAVRVHSRIRTELGYDIPITDLFRYPTIRTLGASLAPGDSARESTPGVPVPSRAQTRAALRHEALGHARQRR